MKVALAQIDCATTNPKENLDKIARHVQFAKKENCKLIVFPEMSDTGYEMENIVKFASPWPGPAFTTLSNIAKEESIYIACGLSEKVNESIFNTLAVFCPKGELLSKYRKTHLFSAPPILEHKYIKSGSSLELLKIGEFTIGLSICFDLRFPEIFRSYVLSGADLFINVAAWPKIRKHHWQTLLHARAIENQCYFLGVGRCGIDGGVEMNASSQIIDPSGEIISQSKSELDELIFADLNHNKVVELRRSFPVLKARRLEIYCSQKQI